jgi:hypothetical protein
LIRDCSIVDRSSVKDETARALQHPAGLAVVASAVVVAMPPMNVVVASVPVAALVGVVMTLRHVVMLMHSGMVMMPARLYMVVLVNSRVVVMLSRRDVMVFMHARVTVVATLGNVVVNVGARPGIVIALVWMPVDNRARRVRVMRLPGRPDTAHTGHTMNAGHPRNPRCARRDVAMHQRPPLVLAGDQGETSSTPGLNRSPPAVPPRRPEAVKRSAER